MSRACVDLAVRLALLAVLLSAAAPCAADLTEAELSDIVMAPYSLGEPTGLEGVWTIETSDGGLAGYIFESRPLAPIPGFGGEPMNMLITIDTEGRFLDVSVLDQKEPIFVAGLGEAPFRAFLRQYRGLSVADSIVVDAGRRSGHDTGSSNVRLDGITKATASVRIANETILAAALKVARERLQGIAPHAVGHPRPDYQEDLDWSALVKQGIAHPVRVSNAELQSAFAGTLWEHDDPEASADPSGRYLDLWAVDIGPPSIRRAVLDAKTANLVERVVAPHEEPILLLANGRHRLVDADFVRNSEPDRIAASQGGLPVLLRDADVDVGLDQGVPAFEQAMVVRADTRLGFDPAAPWDLSIRAVRKHGQFLPEFGVRDLKVAFSTPARFFETPKPPENKPAWRAALEDRAVEMAFVTALLIPLIWLLARRIRWFSRLPGYRLIRLCILGFTVVFIGWFANGQLSIVTPLGVLDRVVSGGSLSFLLYEPLILLIWIVTLLSLAVWGRGFFCGWLCPYGALQEISYQIGRWLRLPAVKVRPIHDRRLKRLKYVILAILVVASLTSAKAAHVMVEVEPFKTAVTMMFDRSWPFVVYAALWLILGVFVFKVFCRYVCPLGAVLAVAGRVRRLDWITRRTECGSPCQLCKARCLYGSIEQDGRIDYSECFQCLDCVTIYDDPQVCIPEVLIHKKGRRLAPVRA